MEHIQHRIATSDDSAWSAHARVTRKSSQFTLELILRGPDQHMARRKLTSASCEALAETTAVMVSLAIESAEHAPLSAGAADGGKQPPPAAEAAPTPPAAVSGDGSPPQDKVTPAPKPAQKPPGAVVSAPARARVRPQPTAATDAEPLQLALELGASIALRAGMLSGGPRWGVRPELAVRVGRLRAALAGNVWFSGESESRAYPHARIDDQALGGDLALGVDLTRTRFTPRPSVGLEWNEIRLRTSGISAPGDVRATWVALGAGIQVEYRVLAGLTPTLGLFGFAPFGRAQFLLQTPRGNIELFTPSPVGLRASLGVTYVFQ